MPECVYCQMPADEPLNGQPCCKWCKVAIQSNPEPPEDEEAFIQATCNHPGPYRLDPITFKEYCKYCQKEMEESNEPKEKSGYVRLFNSPDTGEDQPE